jgi:hypothetical protein
MMMKLIRLGWTIETYKSATNGDLIVELSDPDTLVEGRQPYRLVACNNVDQLPTFAAVECIEITIKEFCLRHKL